MRSFAWTIGYCRRTPETGEATFLRVGIMSQIEKGSTNVYADLGLENAEKMLVKAQR